MQRMAGTGTLVGWLVAKVRLLRLTARVPPSHVYARVLSAFLVRGARSNIPASRLCHETASRKVNDLNSQRSRP